MYTHVATAALWRLWRVRAVRGREGRPSHWLRAPLDAPTDAWAALGEYDVVAIPNAGANLQLGAWLCARAIQEWKAHEELRLEVDAHVASATALANHAIEAAGKTGAPLAQRTRH